MTVRMILRSAVLDVHHGDLAGAVLFYLCSMFGLLRPVHALDWQFFVRKLAGSVFWELHCPWVPIMRCCHVVVCKALPGFHSHHSF